MRDYRQQTAGLRGAAKGLREIDMPKTAEQMDDAADAIEELIAAVPTWISVEERLPEDFQKVLVFWWEHGEPMIDTAFWQKDAKRFDGEHWVRMEDKVTHWMPLPDPPKEDKL